MRFTVAYRPNGFTTPETKFSVLDKQTHRLVRNGKGMPVLFESAETAESVRDTMNDRVSTLSH